MTPGDRWRPCGSAVRLSGRWRGPTVPSWFRRLRRAWRRPRRLATAAIGPDIGALSPAARTAIRAVSSIEHAPRSPLGRADPFRRLFLHAAENPDKCCILVAIGRRTVRGNASAHGAGVFRGHRLFRGRCITPRICTSSSAGCVNWASIIRNWPGIAFAVRRMTIDFLRAAAIDDLLEVETVVPPAPGRMDGPPRRSGAGAETIATAMSPSLRSGAGRAVRLPQVLMAAIVEVCALGRLKVLTFG